MADEKENGILSRLFGTQKSSCCGMRIEEITEEKDAESTKEEIENIPPFSNHLVVVVNAHLKTPGSNPDMAER